MPSAETFMEERLAFKRAKPHSLAVLPTHNLVSVLSEVGKILAEIYRTLNKSEFRYEHARIKM